MLFSVETPLKGGLTHRPHVMHSPWPPRVERRRHLRERRRRAKTECASLEVSRVEASCLTWAAAGFQFQAGGKSGPPHLTPDGGRRRFHCRSCSFGDERGVRDLKRDIKKSRPPLYVCVRWIECLQRKQTKGRNKKETHKCAGEYSQRATCFHFHSRFFGEEIS